MILLFYIIKGDYDITHMQPDVSEEKLKSIYLITLGVSYSTGLCSQMCINISELMVSIISAKATYS